MGTERLLLSAANILVLLVEKMGPPRGDGNDIIVATIDVIPWRSREDGPLRGDGNHVFKVFDNHNMRREDGSPSWGRKPYYIGTFAPSHNT